MEEVKTLEITQAFVVKMTARTVNRTFLTNLRNNGGRIVIKKVKLKTKGMFDDCDPNEEDFDLWKSIEAYMDGEEALVAEAMAKEGEYVFLCLLDNEKDKELFYMMEQDGMTGMYIDDRESFDKDWDSKNYDRDGVMYLKAEWLEDIRELNDI